MLVIRLQRTGRKGHAQFRVVVQDSRRTPTSGRVVAALGSYNPHTKEVILDKEKAAKYLSNGAQPSDRVVRILQAEKVALPAWVKVAAPKEGKLRNPEKLRRNQLAEEAAPEAEAPVEEAVAEEAPAAEAEAPAEEVATEEPKAEEA
jgi:small subunit ribosomal protein S16